MRVQCSTCLELLTPEDDLTCTPCGHVFHLACVIQWFENKKGTCSNIENMSLLMQLKFGSDLCTTNRHDVDVCFRQNCPQCRHTANERTLRKIFLADTEDQSGGVDAGTLQAQLDSAQFQVIALLSVSSNSATDQCQYRRIPEKTFTFITFNRAILGSPALVTIVTAGPDEGE